MYPLIDTQKELYNLEYRSKSSIEYILLTFLPLIIIVLDQFQLSLFTWGKNRCNQIVKLS